jgi:hypothetical protein
MPKGIYKTVAATTAQGGQPVRERVADFSYQNESLAQLIVFAWADQNFRNQLLSNPSTAKQALADRGIYLKAPFVITEDQYNNGYNLPDPEGVVFVLPDPPRTETPPQGQTLLETAKLLMACTPNGI